jgi:two-component system sensor histidine kinase UhpB
VDLKWFLVRRISAVALACLFAGSALALYQTASEARRKNDELVELVAKRLEHQLGRVIDAANMPRRFPDWEPVTEFALHEGQSVEFQDHAGTTVASRSAGIDLGGPTAPPWFVAAYSALTQSMLTSRRPIMERGAVKGTVVAGTLPLAAANAAWAGIAPLLGLSALFVIALCVMTYLVIDRALQPTQQILAALNGLARGDLSRRLPTFRLAELNRISEVFNALAEDLSKATQERAELARRLVDTQEHERRHIARELHDEIAQKLSALNAMAACVRASAKRDAPGLVEEARRLETTASDLMVSLRRTLTYLRPQVIDDLGLVQSLQALVADHNRDANGRTRYAIEVEGDIEDLRAETSAHVYRIVQEALTNTAKHANARRVTVALKQICERSGPERISLSVIDDGMRSSEEAPVRNVGSGLIGMRERVAALSGTFAAGPLPEGGFGLRVDFPTSQGGV